MSTRLSRLLAAVLLATTCWACAAATPADQKELSGVVRDRLSGRRISGVTITFTSDTLYTDSTRTDGDGRYELVIETDTPLGQVRAEHAGYQTTQATVFFDAPERTIDLELLPSSTD